MFLVKLAFSIRRCEEGETISKCNCSEGKVYVNQNISTHSMLCTFDLSFPSIPNGSYLNTVHPFLENQTSACDIRNGRRAATLAPSGNFYCYDENYDINDYGDCQQEYWAQPYENNTCEIEKCNISVCLNSVGVTMLVFGTNYTGLNLCQSCPENATCADSKIM